MVANFFDELVFKHLITTPVSLPQADNYLESEKDIFVILRAHA